MIVLNQSEQPMSYVVSKSGGVAFESGEDRARIIVSANDSCGRYSLLEWTVAANELPVGEQREYGSHLHHRCEETFLIQSGSLEFLIGDEVATLSAGDFARVPPGVRHGYQNVSGEPVVMLVTFTPGGIEELFLKYRSDQPEIKGAGFVSDATRYHGSEFGLPYP
ncbi:MAG: cupin domain-containing protein [Pseudomonadales bacterium]|nr:cupin domain-containing protein [Pseudomonadales bacterium]